MQTSKCTVSDNGVKNIYHPHNRVVHSHTHKRGDTPPPHDTKYYPTELDPYTQACINKQKRLSLNRHQQSCSKPHTNTVATIRPQPGPFADPFRHGAAAFFERRRRVNEDAKLLANMCDDHPSGQRVHSSSSVMGPHPSATKSGCSVADVRVTKISSYLTPFII